MLLLAGVAPAASAYDPGAYRELLARHVRPGEIGGVRLNVVDYAAVGRDPLYAKAVGDLAAADPDGLPTESARFAFWINAYNLLAIKTVVDHYPVAGIRDAGGLFSPVWKKPAGVVGGKTMSLHEIEHGVLRPRFRDPRVHFAIVCASVSCPDLRAEPYDGSRLPAQLDDATRAFLSNTAKGLGVDGATKAVSAIFGWFDEDFAPGGGVVSFIRAKADPAVAARVADARDADLSWLPYDWSLNDAARAK